MIGTIDILPEFTKQIAQWFCASFDDPYNNPRMAKSMGLYQLAATVTQGVIVELGAYQGNGAISLAAGSQGRRLVYTIDDYQQHVDWMGNEPGRVDKALLHLNIEESGYPIAHINQSTEEAEQNWDMPIGLLFWDTGSNDLLEDFWLWSKHLVMGGLFVMHDTDDRHFHSDEVTKEALERGWALGPTFRTLYTVVKPSPEKERTT